LAKDGGHDGARSEVWVELKGGSPGQRTRPKGDKVKKGKGTGGGPTKVNLINSLSSGRGGKKSSRKAKNSENGGKSKKEARFKWTPLGGRVTASQNTPPTSTTQRQQKKKG